METDMTTLSLKTVMAALLAGSLAVTAGDPLEQRRQQQFTFRFLSNW